MNALLSSLGRLFVIQWSSTAVVCVVFAGFVTWKEFHIHFLLAKGYKLNETLQHVDDYESLSIESEGWLLLLCVLSFLCTVWCIWPLAALPQALLNKPVEELFCKLHFCVSQCHLVQSTVSFLSPNNLCHYLH